MLPDFDRPLSKRGETDAPEMGRRLSKRRFCPDAIVSSSAKRALHTAGIVADQIGFQRTRIVSDDRIYEATVAELTAVVRGWNADWNHVVLFGHNPGLTELANWLTKSRIENLPTCSVVDTELDISAWKDIVQYCGRLVEFDFPKNK